MDWDDSDDAAFVEAVNNAADDELAAGDAERMIGAGGCFALVIAFVIVAALAFSSRRATQTKTPSPYSDSSGFPPTISRGVVSEV